MKATKQHAPIEDSEMHQAFRSVSNFCWNAAKQWDWFAKSTIGKQLVTSADSVGANLTEGAGRYGKAEAIHFFIIARASARETRYWLSLCADRGLIDKADVNGQIKKLEGAARALNALITYRRDSNLSVKESIAPYDEDTRHNTQDIPRKTQHTSDPFATEHIFNALDLEPDFGSHLMEEND